MLSRLRQIGPGAIVAAAFIGPGTITTATLAGAKYGYTLLWAVLFSVFATLVLQEMSARLGVVSGMGLGEALRRRVQNPLLKSLIAAMVIAAILVGNSAYEAGNMTGAAIGCDAFGPDPMLRRGLLVVIAAIAGGLLFAGRYQLIERTLVGLVAIMGVVFLVTAIAARPDHNLIFRHLFIPEVPGNALLLVIGLVGTTVVPYNLFLHASSSRIRWRGKQDLPSARWDTVISVIGGGVITMAILVVGAVAAEGASAPFTSAADLSLGLEPLLGTWAPKFLAVGFFAAGFSSTVTAPLAAAIATTEILGRSQSLRSRLFRGTWLTVILFGLVVSLTGFQPVQLIVFSQVANGLLLPVIAACLIWIVNDRSLLGEHGNTRIQNVLGLFVLAVSLLLGLRAVAGGLGAI